MNSQMLDSRRSQIPFGTSGLPNLRFVVSALLSYLVGYGYDVTWESDFRFIVSSHDKSHRDRMLTGCDFLALRIRKFKLMRDGNRSQSQLTAPLLGSGFLAFSTAIIAGAISLIPYNRYVVGSLGLASLILCGTDRQRPANKLRRLEASIDFVAETLKLTTATYARKYVELMELTSRFHEWVPLFIANSPEVTKTFDFYRAKLSASNIRSQLLETRSVSTRSEFVEYMRNSKEIWQSIRQCSKKVEEIRISIKRIVEADRQRELSKDIEESREIISSLRPKLVLTNYLQCTPFFPQGRTYIAIACLESEPLI
ncbi:hypothetical protein B0H12DRAFT_1075373 [Mycena haematopus]|nr:hypothetical protein B0H12DRAFT_1075373 [Mycena haematopus]